MTKNEVVFTCCVAGGVFVVGLEYGKREIPICPNEQGSKLLMATFNPTTNETTCYYAEPQKTKPTIRKIQS